MLNQQRALILLIMRTASRIAQANTSLAVNAALDHLELEIQTMPTEKRQQ